MQIDVLLKLRDDQPEQEGDLAPVVANAWIDDEDRWRGYAFQLAYTREGALREYRVYMSPRDTSDQTLDVGAVQDAPIGSLDRAARQAAAEKLREWDDSSFHDDEGLSYLRLAAPRARDWIEATADPVSRDDEAATRLARICQRYLELDGRTNWKQKLADEFGIRGVDGIPTLIARARKRGFLSPTKRGQQGGYLTPKSLRLLVPADKRDDLERLVDRLRETEIDAASIPARFDADTVNKLAAAVASAPPDARNLLLMVLRDNERAADDEQEIARIRTQLSDIVRG